MTGNPILRARALRREYGRGEGLVRAVDGIDLDVARGEAVAVMGPSGCGKSTLLHLLGGLDRPSGGELWFHGRRIEQLSERALAEMRRREVGFVFQAWTGTCVTGPAKPSCSSSSSWPPRRRWPWAWSCTGRRYTPIRPPGSDVRSRRAGHQLPGQPRHRCEPDGTQRPRACCPRAGRHRAFRAVPRRLCGPDRQRPHRRCAGRGPQHRPGQRRPA
jgi:hypothetical protein